MKKTLCIILSLITCFLLCLPVAAVTTKKELNKDKKENENRLNQVNEQINDIEDEKSQAQAGLDASQALLVELLANVEIIKGDIANKEAEIEQARQDYEAAEAEERKQYAAMCARIRYMYENGNTSSDYIEILLKAESLTDAINKAEYAEKLYEYDRALLESYQAIKQKVAELQASLDEEMAELQEIQQEYEEQEKALNATIEEQRRTVEDFSAKLAEAKSKAKAYQKKIDEDNAQIAKIAAAEKEAARKAAEE
ncbi:MAG: hydrolase Nlp/P60, partial [Lachnospiraceae bacterium]|nr:hydrolase Nlp/P60 [Lachnospiraceae bacterium]